MGLLERWDKRNQSVLEEHNRRPAPTRADFLVIAGNVITANVVFRLSREGIDGWAGWVVGAVVALGAALLVSAVIRRRSGAG